MSESKFLAVKFGDIEKFSSLTKSPVKLVGDMNPGTESLTLIANVFYKVSHYKVIHW